MAYWLLHWTLALGSSQCCLLGQDIFLSECFSDILVYQLMGIGTSLHKLVLTKFHTSSNSVR